jgi:predicted  nucleic acid-binding Zn-ribbon protein
VYFIDDGSTDDTIRQVEPFVNRGVIAVERRRPPSRDGRFEWQAILERKAALARELDADWFIHHDADEFRESPWAGLTLAEAVGHVDALGYNAIDFECLDFWPVRDDFRPGDDVRDAFAFYSPSAPYNALQIRCWKKTTGAVDLESSGGHEARFDGRRVFPLRFLLRHYPVRGRDHGARKVFEERIGRFDAAERARGWHVQYDAFGPDTTFVHDEAGLTPYDPAAVRVRLSLRHHEIETLTEAVHALSMENDRLRDALERARRDLSWTCGQIATLNRGLDERAAQVESLGARLEEMHQRVIATDAERRALHEALDRRHAEAAAREQALGDLSGRLAELHERLVAREREAAALHGALGQARDAAARYESDARRLRPEVTRLQEELAAVRRAAESAAARVDALEHSVTWRWTAPLRAAVALLGRRR